MSRDCLRLQVGLTSVNPSRIPKATDCGYGLLHAPFNLSIQSRVILCDKFFGAHALLCSSSFDISMGGIYAQFHSEEGLKVQNAVDCKVTTEGSIPNGVSMIFDIDCRWQL